MKAPRGSIHSSSWVPVSFTLYISCRYRKEKEKNPHNYSFTTMTSDEIPKVIQHSTCFVKNKKKTTKQNKTNKHTCAIT